MSNSSNASNPAPIRVLRITRLALHVAVGLALSGLAYPFLRARGRAACFRWWSRHLLGILHVRVVRRGDAGATPPGAPVLVLSNHVSWLDVFVIRASIECRFVAKSEIRQWPLVGWMVGRQGTVFVQRARRHDTSRVNRTLEDALRGGDRMAVFPEGTTTDGTEVKPFHGSLLQPLVHAEGYALPVALRYRHEDGRLNGDATYTGDRSLWDSTKLLAAQREIFVDLTILPPVHAVGRHRRDLAQHCAHAVAEALSLPMPGSRSGTPAHPPAGTP